MPLSFLQENCEGVFPHVENLLLPSFCRKKAHHKKASFSIFENVKAQGATYYFSK